MKFCILALISAIASTVVLVNVRAQTQTFTLPPPINSYNTNSTEPHTDTTTNTTADNTTAIPTGPPTFTPTWSPTFVPTFYPTFTPTLHPTLPPTPEPTYPNYNTPIPVQGDVGDEGLPLEVFPLGLCQGDCDTDEECGWGLYCLQRNGRSDPVPGCLYTTEDNDDNDDSTSTSNDICAPLVPLTAQSPSILPGAFRLRLYWDKLSLWQESPNESFWCVTFEAYDEEDAEDDEDDWDNDDDDWLGGRRTMKKLEIDHDEGNRNHKRNLRRQPDSKGNTRALQSRDGRQMIIAKCIDDSRAPPGSYIDEYQSFVLVPVGRNGAALATPIALERSITKDTQVLIKLGNGEQQCWERWRQDIFLRPCDESNLLQRWMANNGTTFHQNKFEISQLNHEQQCVSNDHHPSVDEVVEMHACRALRKWDSKTSFWEIY